MKPTLLSLFLSCLPLASAMAAADPAALPKKIANLRFLDKTDFEREENGRGLGQSYRYEGRGMLKADIFLYDKRMQGLPDGTESAEAAAEIAAVPHVMAQMEQMGKYRDVERLDGGTKVFGGVAFLWSRYSYEQVPGPQSMVPGTRISDTFIRISGGKFVKVRVTMMKNDQERDEKDIEALMTAIAKQG